MSEATLPPAPTKVCPHCQAQAQTTDSKCPHCGKKYKKGSTALKVLAVLAVLFVVGVAGCVALVGTAANEVGKELDAQQKASAITPETFNRLRIGQSRAEVDRAVAPAKPADAQEFQQEGVLDSEQINSSCIYFNKEGGEFGDVYQLCFDETRLTSKNSY